MQRDSKRYDVLRAYNKCKWPGISHQQMTVTAENVDVMRLAMALKEFLFEASALDSPTRLTGSGSFRPYCGSAPQE